MASQRTIPGLAARLPLRARVAVGAGALVLAAWASLYGRLWDFERHDAHRFTAKAILTGTLRMRSAVSLAQHDEQIFNGGVYTNWGFGVPLLQLPFQALAGWLHIAGGFFPDRAIFFVYLTAFMPVLWIAFDRLLRSHPAVRPAPDGRPLSRETRLALSWAATWLVLVMTVYPFMSTRFAIYEETLAYLALCELLALCGYIFAQESAHPGWVALMAGGAGLGLLVRPTGLVHLGVWGATVLLGGVRAPELELRWRERGRRVAVFAVAAAPFVAFWLYSNRVRTGSVVGLGLNNSNPAWIYGTAPQRFGSICLDTPLHSAEALLRMLQGFFLYVTPHAPVGSWLRRCHVDFEERDGTGEPLFGPVILALLVWILVRHLRRPRETRLAVYLPYGAMLVLFLSYVWAGSQFVWRYTGDFWPLIVLACVQGVQTDGGERTPARPPTARLAKFLFWGGLVYFFRYLVPFQWSSRAEMLTAAEVAALAPNFAASRWDHDPPVRSKLRCNEPRDPLYHNGLGWNDDCSVYTFTNVYLGVLPRSDGHYRLRLTTDGFSQPRFRVYLNGRIYSAERDADGYVADVTIPGADLSSPVVMATVEWIRALDPMPGRLLAVELS